jgi:hypothetical protein
MVAIKELMEKPGFLSRQNFHINGNAIRDSS